MKKFKNNLILNVYVLINTLSLQKNKDMRNYNITVWFRFVSNRELEKDFDVYDIEANSKEEAESLVSKKYGSKYSIFKFEIIENMSKSLLFNLTNPA